MSETRTDQCCPHPRSVHTVESHEPSTPDAPTHLGGDSFCLECDRIASHRFTVSSSLDADSPEAEGGK